MRWMAVFVTLALFAGAVSAQMPTVSREDLASDILKGRMGEAEDYLAQAEFAFGRSEYTNTKFLLTDAEFELGLAIEFGLPPDHMAADYIRDGVAKVRADMEEWGDDEAEQQVAQTWWDRMCKEHAMNLASQLLDWVDDEAMLTAEEAYWIPPYFARIIAPELQQFQEKYPDEAALIALVPDAELTVGAGWSRARMEDREKDRFDWVPEVITQANEALEQYVIDSLAEILQYGKEQVLQETGEGGVPISAFNALDAARVMLSRQPDNEMAQKIHDKAMEYIEVFWEDWLFKIEDMVMPEDRSPEDAALHAAMQAAYQSEAAELGWNDQVLRVVVTSAFSEGWEAWWVENVVHAGYFKRITGAVAVQQADECRVMRCLFRQQRQDDGTWSNLYLGKVITSYPILQENVNP